MSDTPRAETARPRGRLKIFLGAAPGVGKTFEMLSDAGERQRAGDDVVAAVVDTHGRAETQALLDALEAMPLAEGAARGEMDLDAVLRRAPALALVDELAHVNASGGRHPRRWQDALELLEAGIDVYATLNIQHVESLSDQVAAITKLAVGDTVPDSLFEEAELEVVDLPPDELLRRLEEGKVKIGEEESRVLAHYFSRTTLSALREMVLRRAAQSIDKQMVAELTQGALPGLFPGSERVLVAVSEVPGADGLVRAAKRLADALRAPWAAIYIETPRAQTFDEAQKRRIADCLRLAATMGATIATVPAETVTEGLAGQIEALRATQLVIGKSHRSWWFTLRHGSVVEKMLRVSDGLAVHVLPAFGAQRGAATRPSAEAPRRASSGRTADYGAVFGLIGITTIIARLIEPVIGVNAIDLVYLLPVIVSSVLFGFRPAMAAGVLAAIAYNFFFVAPRYTLSLLDPEALISLAILVGVAAFTSRLAGRLKTRATLGVRSAQDNAAVASFAQTLTRVSDRKGTARAVCGEVARLLDVDAILLVDREGTLKVVASEPEGLTLGPVDEAAADWAWQRGEQAGVGTSTLNAADWLFVPLKTSLGTSAVLGVARESGHDPVPADRAVLLSALVGQAALAHERLLLEDDMRQVATLKSRDTIRMKLLSAMGRDLAEPLRMIASALDEAAGTESGSPQVAAARQEANRLQRFLGDLIDMVAIDSGEIPLDPEPTDLVEAVSDAAHDIHDLLRDTRIDLHMPGDLPRVTVDRRMLHHILVNLLSTAVRAGTEGAVVRVAGRRTTDALELAVERRGNDGEGEAVPLDADNRHLGLALVKGFADAIGVAVAGTDRAQTLRFPDTVLVGAAA